VGSIICRTRETRFAGKPPMSACLRTVASSLRVRREAADRASTARSPRRTRPPDSRPARTGKTPPSAGPPPAREAATADRGSTPRASALPQGSAPARGAARSSGRLRRSRPPRGPAARVERHRRSIRRRDRSGPIPAPPRARRNRTRRRGGERPARSRFHHLISAGTVRGTIRMRRVETCGKARSGGSGGGRRSQESQIPLSAARREPGGMRGSRSAGAAYRRRTLSPRAAATRPPARCIAALF